MLGFLDSTNRASPLIISCLVVDSTTMAVEKILSFVDAGTGFDSCS